jgi:peptide/nickel transport system ATP-binding protein
MSAEMPTPLLAVDDMTISLTSRANSLPLVTGLSLQIMPGECYALIGESGCGKSITSLAINRLLGDALSVTSGEIRMAGQNLLALPEHEMRTRRGSDVAMIFQEPMSSLNPVLTIGRQLAEALPQSDTDAEHIVALLEQVGIPEPERRAHEYPHQLSGGMKQRVMIAMAIARKPKLLIADEPTTALDVTVQAEILLLLKQLQSSYGMGLLLITHDLGIAAQVADRIGVMYAGELVEEGVAARLLSEPRHPYTYLLLAALPGRGKSDRALATIPGMVPAAGAFPPGCRFAPRCPLADELCTSTVVYADQGNAELVRCVHPLREVPDQVERDSLDPASASANRSVSVLESVDVSVRFPIRRGLLRRIGAYVEAVNGVSIQLVAGKTFALVGESGCGKSTLAKGMVGLNSFASGRMVFDGNEIRLSDINSPAFRSDVQMVFQDPYASLNPRRRVDQILQEGIVALGRAQATREQQVALLGKVGLEQGALTRYPHQFSGGQRQRICIARALAVQPRVLILDEPTSALDVSVQAQIINLLKSLQQQLGLAYLFITHDLSLVEYLADEIGVMYRGKIVEQGAASAILAKPAHPYTEGLWSAQPGFGAGLSGVKSMPTELLFGEQTPAGCSYASRCERAESRCIQSIPPATAVDAKRRVSCFNPLVAAQ